MNYILGITVISEDHIILRLDPRKKEGVSKIWGYLKRVFKEDALLRANRNGVQIEIRRHLAEVERVLRGLF
jgi:hypothetical protein